MSLIGTFQIWRDDRLESAFEGKPDLTIDDRRLPILTIADFEGVAKDAPAEPKRIATALHMSVINCSSFC